MHNLPPDIAAFVPQRIPSALTVRAAFAVVLAELEVERFRSLRELRTAERRFGAAFGDVALAELEPLVLVAWLRSQAHRGDLAPKTVRKLLWGLRKVLDRCVLGGALDRNPARDLPRDIVPRNRVRDPGRAAAEVLDPEELERVLDADNSDQFPPNFVALLALLGLAGLRIGEASALEWGDVRAKRPLHELIVGRAFHGKDRRVVSTKADQVRRVPVHPALERVLARARAWFERRFRRAPRSCDLVAPFVCGPRPARHWRQATALRWWHRGARALGLAERRLHGLRHTFVSTLINAGASEDAFESGRRNDARIYVHYTWPTLCSAVEQLELTVRGPRLELAGEAK